MISVSKVKVKVQAYILAIPEVQRTLQLRIDHVGNDVINSINISIKKAFIQTLFVSIGKEAHS